MVDAMDSKSIDGNIMRVQVSPAAPKLTCSEMTAPRGEYAALRRVKSAFVFAVKSHNSPQRIETTQTKTKCVLYARKSTEEDDQQIMSIETQLFELREYASRERIEIVKVF